MIHNLYSGSDDYENIMKRFINNGVNAANLNLISEASYNDEIWEDLGLTSKL